MIGTPVQPVQTVACPKCHTLNRVADADRPNAHCGKCGTLLFGGQPVELDEASFDRHLRADTPLLVDFWAPWCGPCRMMAPAYARAAAVLEPQMRVAKVDTDAQQALAARYNIRSIPTLALFRGGREVARHSGAMDLARLTAWARAQP